MDATLAPGGSICVGLTVRFNPGEYHWLLWLLDEDGSNGTCAHAVDRTGAFQFEKKPCKAGGPDVLSVLVRVGSLGNHTVAGLVTILEKIPIASPVGTDDENVRFTCRVWVREAIRVLHRHGILVCDDVNALERELVRLGDENREAVETGMGEPLYYVSAVSRYHHSFEEHTVHERTTNVSDTTTRKSITTTLDSPHIVRPKGSRGVDNIFLPKI